MDRFLKNWKSTVSGFLIAGAAVAGALQTTNPTTHWLVSFSAAATALLGVIAKDK
jgi:hypothetical protein